MPILGLHMIEILIVVLIGAVSFLGMPISPEPGQVEEPENVAPPTVEYAEFRAALHDCATYLQAKDLEVLRAPNPFFARSYDEDIEDGRLSMYYPEFVTPFPMIATAFYDAGNSTTAAEYQCSATGEEAPVWPIFTGEIYPEIKTQLLALGYDEIDFPAAQKFFANCGSDKPDAFLLFNAGDGDRVVFAAQGGDTAQIYCNNFGIKE